MKSVKYLKFIPLMFIALSCSCEKIINNYEVVVGEGPLVVEERNLLGFFNVSSQIGADINIIESDNHRVEISIQENLLPYLKTSVFAGELTISFDNVSVRTDKTITIDIYTNSLEKFSLSGAGNVHSNLPINEIFLSGSGNVACIGETDNLKATITGAGNFNFFQMPVKNANLRITGSGNINVDVSQRLDVTISGAGNIYYRGNPVINQTISGFGSVINSN